MTSVKQQVLLLEAIQKVGKSSSRVGNQLVKNWKKLQEQVASGVRTWELEYNRTCCMWKTHFRKEAIMKEAKLQDRIKKFLEDRGWLVEISTMGRFQAGWPDMFAHHPKYGPRWIEVKKPKPRDSPFTKAQRVKFPKWDRAGVGIWVLVADDEEEYDKLFHLPNWTEFWKKTWGDPYDQKTGSDIIIEAFKEEHDN